MAEIIYRGKFYCPICKRDIAVPLLGDPSFEINEQVRQDVKQWGKHYHWIDNHRCCAICGKLVKSDDLELLVDDGSVMVHEAYNEEYKKPTRGLLIVHKECAEGKAKRR